MQNSNKLNRQQKAAELHKQVPPNHYARSIKESFLHRFWHTTRFKEIGVIIEKSKATKVVGIDVLAASISYAKRRFARSKIVSFRVADAHALPVPTRTFDAVFCLETLEHVEDPTQVASEIHRVLKDDGYAVILVPNENILFRIGWFFWLMGPGKIWKNTHIQDLSAEAIMTTLGKANFRTKETRRFLLGMLQAVKVVKK